MQWANPRSLIVNIEGAIDYSCLENYSEFEQNQKIFALYHFNIL